VGSDETFHLIPVILAKAGIQKKFHLTPLI